MGNNYFAIYRVGDDADNIALVQSLPRANTITGLYVTVDRVQLAAV